MQGNMFNANQIITIGQALGDGEGKVLAGGIERDSVASNRRWALLPHLEPHLAAAIKGRSRVRRLGHVDVEHTRVEDDDVGLETDGGTGGHGGGVCAGSGVKSANVASKVIRCHVGHRRVRVGILADTGILGSGFAVGDKLVEAV
jgi:hypothetical protein